LCRSERIIIVTSMVRIKEIIELKSVTENDVLNVILHPVHSRAINSELVRKNKTLNIKDLSDEEIVSIVDAINSYKINDGGTELY